MAITMDCVVTNFWKLSRAIKSIWYHSEVCCFNRNPLISASSSFVQLLFCVLSAWLLYFIVIIMWAMNRVVFMVKGLSALFSRTRKTKSYWYKFFNTKPTIVLFAHWKHSWRCFCEDIIMCKRKVNLFSIKPSPFLMCAFVCSVMIYVILFEEENVPVHEWGKALQLSFLCLCLCFESKVGRKHGFHV